MLINIYIVFSVTTSATNLTKTVAKNSYSLLEYLHGMQGVSGSSPLGSTYFSIIIGGFQGCSLRENKLM